MDAICDKMRIARGANKIAMTDKTARRWAYDRASVYLFHLGYTQYRKGHNLPLQIKCIISSYFDGKSTKKNLMENLNGQYCK